MRGKSSKVYYLRCRYDNMLRDRWKSLDVSDKEVACKKAADFRREYEAEAADILLLKTLRQALGRPLLAHLNDYLADLRQRGKTGEYIQTCRARIQCVLKACVWRYFADITPDSFISWHAQQNTLAPRTLNHY